LKHACVNEAMTEINTATVKPVKTGANPLGGAARLPLSG
jgi:hypothetical protein